MRFPVSRSGFPPIRAIVLGLAAFLATLAGCRSPPTSFHTLPLPALSDELAIAERRAGVRLDADGFAAYRAAHELYLAAWERLVRDEAEPLARAVRAEDEEALRRDLARLRALTGRQKAMLGRAAALDAELAAAIAGVGPGSDAIAARWLARRALVRTNAVLVADGGATLAEFRGAVEAARRDPEVAASPEGWDRIEDILDRHEDAAIPLLAAIAAAAVELAVDWREREDRLPTAEAAVDPALEGDARINAIRRLEWERIAAARERLGLALARLAEREEFAVGEIHAIRPDLGEALRLRQFRLRARDGRTGDEVRRLAFLALVASEARELSPEARDAIRRERRDFLRADAERLAELSRLVRSGFEPGVFEPGGPGAGGVRANRLREIDGDRVARTDAFRARLDAALPEPFLARLQALQQTPERDLPAALAGLVPSGRVARLLAAIPRGFAAEAPPEDPVDAPEPGEGSRELAMFLPAAIGPTDLARLADAVGADQAERETWNAILAAYRERRDEARRVEDAAFQRILSAAVQSVVRPTDAAATSRAIRAVFADADAIRVRRRGEDLALLDDLAAATTGGLPADERAFRRALWSERSRRTDWYRVPGADLVAWPREASVGFASLLDRLDLTVAERGTAATLLAEFGVEVATDAVEAAWADAVRELFVAAIDAQLRGERFEPEDRIFAAELARIRGPALAAGRRLATLHRELLERIARDLPASEARRLREAFLEAAYPGLLREADGLSEALERTRRDGRLPEETQGEILVVLDERDAARDAALRQVMDWLETVDDPRRFRDPNPNAFRAADPLFGYLLALRREADLRAARRIADRLDAAALARHPRLGRLADAPEPDPSEIRTWD